jgi:ADP-sugar diphosphatase
MASSGEAAPQQLSATVAVPGAVGPVRVVAAPGLPEADFRKAMDSALFRRWLENLQTEKGVLAYGKLSLRQILIQVGASPPSLASECLEFAALTAALCAGG